ncbi:hypothetical protein [Benzoatithermus flavus]|uniref:Uncharacterized protein n=1 Tax=Benzoatithermus flavus TaxID=3108223 RepID=A0ABU8Y050_9PROT
MAESSGFKGGRAGEAVRIGPMELEGTLVLPEPGHGIVLFAPGRVLAEPMAPADTAEMLRAVCDEVVFLATPADFWAVGHHYDDSRQLDDEGVIAMLAQAPCPAGTDATSVWHGGDRA